MGNQLRVCLLISGGGTTAAAIINACKTGELSYVQPACVIASRATAGGIKKVLDLGMLEKNVLVINPRNYSNEEAFGEVIIAECRKRGVDFIGQYGWLAHTPANVVQAYEDMMVNQHNGPLDPGYPDFGGKGMFGLAVHYARIEYVNGIEDQYWTEATAQRVAIDYDKGPLLGTLYLEIREDETCYTLHQRLLPVEHGLQIEVLRQFSQNQVKETERTQRLIPPEHYSFLEEIKKRAAAIHF